MFVMKMRDCPNGKSMPAIHGPGFLSAVSNSPKSGHSSRLWARRTRPSNVHCMHVSGFLRDGLDVKSIPITIMPRSSTVHARERLPARWARRKIKGLRGIEWVSLGSEGPRKLCISSAGTDTALRCASRPRPLCPCRSVENAKVPKPTCRRVWAYFPLY